MKKKKTTTKKLIESGVLVVGNVLMQDCASYTQTNKGIQKRGNTEDTEWEGHKHVKDVNEHKRVRSMRSILASRIARLGTNIAGMGYLVPIERAAELDEVFAGIDADVRKYNAESNYTRLDAWFNVFEISGSDERIARVVYKKASDLLEATTEAIQKGDVKALRLSLANLKGVTSMIPSTQAADVTAFIDETRKAAKEALKKAKEVDTDKMEKSIRKDLKKVPVNAIRAQMIEVVEDIEKRSDKLTVVSSIGARHIEVQ